MLKLQNSPKVPDIHARFIVMQMSKVNVKREKGYYTRKTCAMLYFAIH